MKSTNMVLLIVVAIIMFGLGFYLHPKLKGSDVPTPLLDSKNIKVKTLPTEKYAAEMIANYHQNLTLEQYRTVKMLTISTADLQALIGEADKNGTHVVRFFLAANTENTVENGDAPPDDSGTPPPVDGEKVDDGKAPPEVNPEEPICTRYRDVVTIVPGIDGNDGTIEIKRVCLQFCPPPDICGDSLRINMAGYKFPGVGTMNLSQIVKYKFPTKNN